MNNLHELLDMSNNNPFNSLLNLVTTALPPTDISSVVGPLERHLDTELSPEFAELFTLLTNPESRNGSQRNNLRNLLNETFNVGPKFKKVLSEKGKTSLKTANYSKELNVNTACPIWQVDFEEDQEITLSPCNHAFTKGALERWLEDEKAECPICRFEFDFKEVKIKKKPIPDNEGEEEGGGTEGQSADQPNEATEIQNSRVNLINSLSRTHPFGRNQLLNTVPHSYIANLMEVREEENMRHAIALSLLDQQNNDQQNNDQQNNDEETVD